jgi:hypothetical protein
MKRYLVVINLAMYTLGSTLNLKPGQKLFHNGTEVTVVRLLK